MSMTIPHELPTGEAVNRIKGLLQQLKSEHGDLITDVKEEWTGDEGKFAFTTRGFDLSGLIKVTPSGVDIDAKLPFAVSFFQGKIKSVISEKAKTLLAK